VLIRIHATGSVASVTLVLATLAAPPMAAQQYSADIVQVPQKSQNTTKLYVGDNKVRLESLENGQPEGGIIWNGGQNTTTIVLDRQQAYIGGNNSALVNQTLSRSGTPAAWRLFHPMNASDPCTDWNALMQQYAQYDSTQPGHATCQSLGSDVVNGRPAQKWAVTSTKNGKTDRGTVWIDSKLHVVTKTQGEDGQVMELRNLQEGPQPESEFQVPPNYHPIDVNAALANLKPGVSDSSLAGLLGAAAKNVGQDATQAGTEAAKEKVRKGIRGILHVP
jgi:hypothetical protein